MAKRTLDPMNLMDRTILLLDESEETLPEIANNVGISYYWLRKFKSGEVPNPGVNRIQQLYEYLTRGKLLTPLS